MHIIFIIIKCHLMFSLFCWWLIMTICVFREKQICMAFGSNLHYGLHIGIIKFSLIPGLNILMVFGLFLMLSGLYHKDDTGTWHIKGR